MPSKASVVAILETIDPAIIRSAIEAGLKAAPPKSFPYVQMAAHYLDGRPRERLSETAEATVQALEQLERLETLYARGLRVTAEEQLAAYRAVRDAVLVPADAAFFLVAWSLMRIVEKRTMDNPRLEKISAEIQAVETAHGLAKDEYWPIGEGPEEYRALKFQWEQIADTIEVETFREHGEDEMANLLEQDRAEFDRRCEAGRQFFFEDESETE